MIYIPKIITPPSLCSVPKTPLTCLTVISIILSDSYDTVILPRPWTESNSKRLNWVSQQIYPNITIPLSSVPHYDFDIDYDQKWITRHSPCKFIEPKDSEGTSHCSTTKTVNYTKLILLITDVTRQYSNISRHDGGEACLKFFQGKKSQQFRPNTLPKLFGSPSPSTTLPQTLPITVEDHTIVLWKKSTHLQPCSRMATHRAPWPCWTYPSCNFSSSPFSRNPLRFCSLSFALSPCPTGLSNTTSLQKEKSTN